MRKAFILIMSVCVLLFTACGQKPVNSEEVSSPQESFVESKSSILTEGGVDLPAAESSTAASAVSENEQAVNKPADEKMASAPSGGLQSATSTTEDEKTSTADIQPTQPITYSASEQSVGSNPNPLPAPTPTEEQEQAVQEVASEPKPTASGDIYSIAEAVRAGNAYAAAQYGVTIDAGMTAANSSFFPGTADSVAWLAENGGQAALTAAVRGNVDATFACLAAMDGAETVSAYARFNCTVRYDAASDEYIVVVLYG